MFYYENDLLLSRIQFKTRLPVKPAMTNRELGPAMTKKRNKLFKNTDNYQFAQSRQGEMPDQVGHDEERIGNDDTSFILILTPALLPHLQQVFKQGHSVFFHLSGIE